jgi:hypothetical protein
MSKSSRPGRITPHAEKLQQAIATRRNQWLTRKMIAQAIGKKRLTPYDIDLLALLADHDLIRMKREEGYSRDGYRWVYGLFDMEPTD